MCFDKERKNNSRLKMSAKYEHIVPKTKNQPSVNEIYE